MLPISIPKEYRGLALLVGGTIAVLTVYKLYTDIKINREKIEDYEAAEK